MQNLKSGAKRGIFRGYVITLKKSVITKSNRDSPPACAGMRRSVDEEHEKQRLTARQGAERVDGG